MLQAYGAEPPLGLRPIYKSFADDDEMFAMLIEKASLLISLHFGIPRRDRIAALRHASCLLLASATSPAEARSIEQAEINIVAAQGWEAGAHRGVFDPGALNDRLGTIALTRLLVR